MSFFHGLGMFIFGMSAMIVGAIVAYFIINKVMEEKKEKTRWDDLE
jgi:phage shock protein PspC (stress-responsive transcriptional regulator)